MKSLPEKWCIRGSKEFSGWLDGVGNATIGGLNPEYYYYPHNYSDLIKGIWTLSGHPEGREEISIEMLKFHAGEKNPTKDERIFPIGSWVMVNTHQSNSRISCKPPYPIGYVFKVKDVNTSNSEVCHYPEGGGTGVYYHYLREALTSEIPKENPKENSRGYTIGDVVVLVADTNNSTNKVGQIGAVVENYGFSFRVQVHGGLSQANISKGGEIRPATIEEIEAYNNGYATLSDYQNSRKKPTPLEKFVVMGDNAGISRLTIGDIIDVTLNPNRIVAVNGSTDHPVITSGIEWSFMSKIEKGIWPKLSDVKYVSGAVPTLPAAKIDGYSKYGYKVGQRVKFACSGGTTLSGLRHEQMADKGECGVITGVDGVYTEVRKDNGKYSTRYENKAWEFMIPEEINGVKPYEKPLYLTSHNFGNSVWAVRGEETNYHQSPVTLKEAPKSKIIIV